MATPEETLGTVERAQNLLELAEELHGDDDPTSAAWFIAQAQAHALIAIVRELKELAIRIEDAQILRS